MCMVIHPEVIETVCLTHKCQPACVALKKKKKKQQVIHCQGTTVV